MAIAGIIANFLGVILLAWGFKVEAMPEAGAFYEGTGGPPIPFAFIRADRKWARWAGWGLLITGFLLQLIAEVCRR